MNETPKLWPHAWSLIRGQERTAQAGLMLTLLSIGASLMLPWPLKVIIDSILIGSTPMPAWPDLALSHTKEMNSMAASSHWCPPLRR